MSKLCFYKNELCCFYVKITPNASITKLQKITPYKEKVILKIQIHSPPEKGKANKELIEFLAKTLSCPQSKITILSGLTDSYKCIGCAQINIDEINSKLREKGFMII